jgi:tetratricopeptide (TPR) repeat protein
MTKPMNTQKNLRLWQFLVKPAGQIILGLGLFFPLAPLQAQTTAPTVNEVALPGETPYDTYMRIGFAADERGDHLAAAEYFRSALFYVPEDREATIAYWNAKHNLNLQTGATGPDTETYERYMRMGYDATERHHYQDALAYFEGALQLRPGDEYASQAIRNVSTYLLEGQ